MTDLYQQNLRLALEYVDILLQNIDAEKAVISADLGEALGEYGIWGHPFGCPLPCVRKVPWVETVATDKRTYESQYEAYKHNPNEHDQKKFLKEMGTYRTNK